jgi:hypothetical protein
LESWIISLVLAFFSNSIESMRGTEGDLSAPIILTRVALPVNMSYRRTDPMAGERYDHPEIYMEIFWYYIQRISPTYNLVHSEGFHQSGKKMFSLVHFVFERPPPGEKVDMLTAIKSRREPTRSKTSTAGPFRTPAKFDGDCGLLLEVEYFAKEIWSMVNQVLNLTSIEERKAELEKQVGERLFLKGDWCWLVIERTKEIPYPGVESTIRDPPVDAEGRIHFKVEVRTLQPPKEWLAIHGKRAKWVGGAKGGLKLDWWTDSRHKEEVSIDDTWTMVSDFPGYT